MQQDYSFIRTRERGGHGAEGSRETTSQKNGNCDEQRTKRQIMCARGRGGKKKCRGEERGDGGGALMDRVKKEQTQERGGEGAVLGQ